MLDIMSREWQSDHETECQLSVVIPAHNEANHIRRTLDQLVAAFRAFEVEVVVVDDGSTDDTIDEVENWIDDQDDDGVRLIQLDHNIGKGGALCVGTMEAKGNWVGWLDADGDIAPSELLKLWNQAQDCGGLVVGNKQRGVWNTAGVPWWRRAVSRTFVLVVQTLYHLPIQDTQTGCKVFPGNWIREILPRVSARGYLLDLEVLVYAHLGDMPVAERPVTVVTQRTANRIGAKHIMRSLGELYGLHQRYRRLRREILHQGAPHAESTG